MAHYWLDSDHAHTRFRRTPVRAAPLKVSLSNVNACHVFFYLTVLSLSRLKKTFVI